MMGGGDNKYENCVSIRKLTFCLRSFLFHLGNFILKGRNDATQIISDY